MAHLQEQRIEALAWGKLSGATLREAEDHVASCDACRSRLHQVQEGVPTDHGRARSELPGEVSTGRAPAPGLVTGESDFLPGLSASEKTRVETHYDPGPDSQDPAPADPEVTQIKLTGPRPVSQRRATDPAGVELEPGTVVGRYSILRTLATGSSGRVYEAVDPSLDRKVALKVMPVEQGAGDGAAESRILREAHAMARLSHPNVVTIHDVGTYEGDAVFLAMELVEGPTLRKWLHGKPHPLREVLDVLIAAGRGLEAAHKAGLVHRDFKPANVLVGVDGRVRVTDFGLARAVSPNAGRSPPEDEQGQSPLEMTFTQAGAVMGTPGYAAPEIVVSGAPADARSDQFSYAATLHEALFGVTPYPGEDFGVYFRALADRKRSRARRRGVPRAVRRTVERGLRLKAAERHESISALLGELRRTTAPRRRGRKLLAALLSGIVIGAAYLALRVDQRRQQVCRNAGGRLERIWSPESKTAIEKAFLASKARFAKEALQLVHANLDEYGRKWTRTRTAACESTWVRGLATSDEFLRRASCLERQLDELDALVAELSKASTEVVASSPKAISQLPPPEQCAKDTGRPRAAAALDAATLDRVRAVQGELARAKAQRALGRYKEGLAIAAPAVEEARKIGDRGTLAEALILEATLHQKVGDPKRSRELAEEAVWVALGGSKDEVAAAALVQLLAADNLGGDMEGAKRTLRKLDDLSARLPPSGEREGLMENIRGNIASSEHRHEDAQSHFERSIAAFEEALGPEALPTINPVYNLGAMLSALNQPEKALPYFQRSLQVDQKVLGANHPDTAWSAAALARCMTRLGQPEEAREILRGALAAHEQTLGKDHFLTGQDLYWLGELELELGNAGEAMALLGRALEIQRKVGNPGITAAVEEAVGRVQLRKRQYAEALRSFERARGLVPGGPAGANAVSVMAGAASALLGQGKKPQALALAEQAAGVAGADPLAVAEAKWALAQALDASGKDRPRARSLALEARQGFARPGKPRPQVVAMDAWLAKRGGPAE